MDSSYEVGYFLPTISRSNTSGVLDYKNCAISPMIYSLVFPDPLDALGCIERIASRRTLVVF